MSNTVAAEPKTAPKNSFNTVVVRGRIEETRRHGSTSYTRVLCPAADEYSRPQTLEIRSKTRLGQKGDTITQACLLGGFTRKPFRAVDKDTGETTMVVPVDHTLDAVED
ncbi:single-stranded DNA-binding protein [Comamonas sp. NoAH]|uniref:single-stranded DNA-binding protein n=1 Tax=Comamonas halotolerans TaxID=3041496 RepID=UPI0024E0EC4A|nr:single-stranded DNA-binding protein [Comamonas sp. NoAH]